MNEEWRKQFRIYKMSELVTAEFPLLEVWKNAVEDERQVGCAVVAVANLKYLLGLISSEEFAETVLGLSLEFEEHGELEVSLGEFEKWLTKEESLKRHWLSVGGISQVPMETLLANLDAGHVLFLIREGVLESDPGHMEVIYMENGDIFANGIRLNFRDLARRVYISDRAKQGVVLVFQRGRRT